MSERPWFRVTPMRVGFSISLGETSSDVKGAIPLRREGLRWRPTRRMAEARGRRYLRRFEAAQQREERSCLVEGSE